MHDDECPCPHCTAERDYEKLYSAIATAVQSNQPTGFAEGAISPHMTVRALVNGIAIVLAQLGPEQRMSIEAQMIAVLFPPKPKTELN